MAYETGSATNANDLLDKLGIFALANGWTIQRNTAGLLFLSKGICAVSIQTQNFNYNDWETGSSVSTPSSRWNMALNVSNDGTRTTFWGHPGSLVTTSADTDRVVTNDLYGPFTEYHFFEGTDGGAGYIHIVARTAAERWRCWGFGHLNKGAYSHTGAAYLVGCDGFYYRNQSAFNIATWYSIISAAPYPFARNSSETLVGSGQPTALYVPDGSPVGWGQWASASAPGGVLSLINGRQKPILGSSGDESYPSSAASNTIQRLLNPLYFGLESQWGGNRMLFTLPFVMTNASAGRLCHIGQYPDVRAVNLEGLQIPQSLFYSTDEWVCFPVGRRTPWGLQSEIGFQYSSGQFGLAFRKNA